MSQQIFILTDENVKQYCLPLLLDKYPMWRSAIVITIAPGEQSKSLSTIETISKTLLENNASRESTLVSLGGGVVCDIGGFVASIFKRGIGHINIPTSLLAMVDASIGCKTGINFCGIKNQLGTFNFGTKTIYVFDFLSSLDKRQILNGAAEMIKIALVRDSLLWQKMKTNPPYNNNGLGFDTSIIKKCIELKLAVVKADPYEKNERKILNFGHTLGHCFEAIALKNGKDLLHGEAIASGMYYAVLLSEKKLAFPSEKAKEILSYLSLLYDIIDIDNYKESLYNYIVCDKKNTEGQIMFVLLEDIGKTKINCPVTFKEINALKSL